MVQCLILLRSSNLFLIANANIKTNHAKAGNANTTSNTNSNVEANNVKANNVKANDKAGLRVEWHYHQPTHNQYDSKMTPIELQ